MTYRCRTLTLGDLAATIPLLDAAYGANPTFEPRLRTYLALEPDGWVAIDGDADSGRGLIGVGGYVSFGACAYIGLIAVAPGAQKRGVGAAVFDEVVRRCEIAGRALLLLDASAAGAPLYVKRGFDDCGLSFSFSVDPNAVRDAASTFGGAKVRVSGVDTADASALEEIARFDAHGYGADRATLVRHLLARYPGRAFVARDPEGGMLGYAVAQSRSFGPCIAVSAEVTHALLFEAIALAFEGPVSWLVPEQNAAAMELAHAVGGAPSRSWRHMRRGDGAALRSDWGLLFAKVSLAVG